MKRLNALTALMISAACMSAHTPINSNNAHDTTKRDPAEARTPAQQKAPSSAFPPGLEAGEWPTYNGDLTAAASARSQRSTRAAANWFPPSYNPQTGLFYVPAQDARTACTTFAITTRNRKAGQATTEAVGPGSLCAHWTIARAS